MHRGEVQVDDRVLLLDQAPRQAQRRDGQGLRRQRPQRAWAGTHGCHGCVCGAPNLLPPQIVHSHPYPRYVRTTTLNR